MTESLVVLETWAQLWVVALPGFVAELLIEPLVLALTVVEVCFFLEIQLLVEQVTESGETGTPVWTVEENDEAED